MQLIPMPGCFHSCFIKFWCIWDQNVHWDYRWFLKIVVGLNRISQDKKHRCVNCVWNLTDHEVFTWTISFCEIFPFENDSSYRRENRLEIWKPKIIKRNGFFLACYNQMFLHAYYCASMVFAILSWPTQWVKGSGHYW